VVRELHSNERYYARSRKGTQRGGQICEAVRAGGWANKVITVDGGAAERTRFLARAVVSEVRRPIIAAQRNARIVVVGKGWILALHADERATDDLRNELAGVLAAPQRAAYR